MNEDRRHSLEQVATGGALYAAGEGGNQLLDARLRRRGAPKSIRAIRQGKFKAGTHLPHLAGKLGVRGTQGVGLPLAAYGAWNAVKPRPEPTAKVDPKRVTRDVVRQATYADQVEAGRARYAKALAAPAAKPLVLVLPSIPTDPLPRIKKLIVRDRGRSARRALHLPVTKALSGREEHALDAHRKAGAVLSVAGGTMGLGALALRAPSGAKALVNRGAKGGRLVRLAAREDAATRHSNTLGIAAIGTGSTGSFNYASQQRLERKKSTVAKDDRPRRDAFLRRYHERISPDAERGYRTLKTGERRNVATAVGSGTMTGLMAGVTRNEIASRNKLGAAVAAASTLGSAITTANASHTAYRWHQKRGKIKAKARSREHRGLYGPGRGLSPVDDSSARARNLAGGASR